METAAEPTIRPVPRAAALKRPTGRSRKRFPGRLIPNVNVTVPLARVTRWDRISARSLILMAIAISGLIHGGVWLTAGLWKPSKPAVIVEKIELSVIEPPPPVVKPKRAPPEIKKLPEPPKEAPPPPPVVEAPKPTPPPVLVTGISLSSTSRSGSFSVATGNTLHGQIADKAVDPNRVKPYKAAEYAPLHLVSDMPECPGNLSTKQLSAYYPEEAKKLALEADVRVKMIIDFDGSVAQAKALNDPGHGFAAAAERVALAQKCKPARVSGRAVATEIEYLIPFVMEQE